MNKIQVVKGPLNKQQQTFDRVNRDENFPMTLLFRHLLNFIYVFLQWHRVLSLFLPFITHTTDSEQPCRIYVFIFLIASNRQQVKRCGFLTNNILNLPIHMSQSDYGAS